MSNYLHIEHHEEDAPRAYSVVWFNPSTRQYVKIKRFVTEETARHFMNYTRVLFDALGSEVLK